MAKAKAKTKTNTKTKPKAKGAALERADWRPATLARMRALIQAADRKITEDRKWAKAKNPLGVPVWSRDGIVCTGETYAKVVKLTFAHGAKLPDPSRLFNSSLAGATRRAIDIHEGEKVDPTAFKTLVRNAVAFNTSVAASRSKRTKS